MKLIINLLTTIYGFYKKVVTPPDYAIIREELEYNVDPGTKYEVDDEFWARESRAWDDLDELYVDVTGRDYKNTVIPQCVWKTVLRVKYWYNGRVYKFISYDMNAPFPPRESSGMSFSLPITKAWLCGEDDKPKRDVTEKIRRYAGPKNDFHGVDVALRDVLYYDEETLRELYPKLLLQNALGFKRTVSTLTGTTSSLR